MTFDQLIVICECCSIQRCLQQWWQCVYWRTDRQWKNHLCWVCYSPHVRTERRCTLCLRDSTWCSGAVGRQSSIHCVYCTVISLPWLGLLLDKLHCNCEVDMAEEHVAVRFVKVKQGQLMLPGSFFCFGKRVSGKAKICWQNWACIAGERNFNVLQDENLSTVCVLMSR